MEIYQDDFIEEEDEEEEYPMSYFEAESSL